VPDGSIDVLIVDHGSHRRVRSKLSPGGVIVSLSAIRSDAGITVPAPSVFESLDDVTAPADAKLASWSMAPGLKKPPDGVIEPAGFIAMVAQTLALAAPKPGALEQERRRRIDAIHSAGRGSVFTFANASTTPVKQFESPAKLWERMTAGATWVDDGEPQPQAARQAKVPAEPRDVAALVPLSTKITRRA
jgi:hypothetical protein